MGGRRHGRMPRIVLRLRRAERGVSWNEKRGGGVIIYRGETHLELTNEENCHESHGPMFTNCVVIDLELSVHKTCKFVEVH